MQSNFFQRRWQADRRINNKKLRFIDPQGAEKEVRTSDIYAGDIVKIKEGEMFPADLLLISTSNKGQCYIETANLDGESNFKPRWSLTETSGFDTPEKLAKLKKCLITCGPPDDELYKFVGTFNIPAELSSELVHATALVADVNQPISISPDEKTNTAPDEKTSTGLLEAPAVPVSDSSMLQFPLTYVTRVQLTMVEKIIYC